MKQLKHVKDNLFIIDTEAEIKEGYGYYPNEPIPSVEYLQKDGTDYGKEYGWSKILYQLNPVLIPKDIPLFELPNQVVDVEKVANDFCKEIQDVGALIKEDFEQCKSYYKSGYSQCLTDNKDKLYTKEDMIEFAQTCYSTPSVIGRTTAELMVQNYIVNKFSEELIPDLSKYDGKEVEILMETYEEKWKKSVVYKTVTLNCYIDNFKMNNSKLQPLLSAEGKIQIKIL